MPGLAAEQDAFSLVRRVARALNRRLSDLVALLFHHKSAGSLGAVAGFAIAVVFAWKFLRSSPARPRRSAPKRPPAGPAAPDSAAPDAVEPVGDAGKLMTRQIVAKRLSGCRKVTCQLLGVVFEEKTPEELQKHATVRPSVVELILEISKYCDFYLIETILDDKSEENALMALESAGLFRSGGLMKEEGYKFVLDLVENIPKVTAEKVKEDMLGGVELALGLSKGSLQQPIYTRIQLWGAALPMNTPSVPCIFDPHGRAGICGD